MEFKVRNVNEAFRTLVAGIHMGTIPTSRCGSRYGEVLQVPEPVLVTYACPRERVLFNAARDANPFFHLYEALWMLAGRNDIEGLCYYNSKYKEFSDDGKTANGAYGYRWRKVHHKGFQGSLDLLVNHLKADPNSRRAVLQMWNVEDDLLKIGKTHSDERECYQCKGERYTEDRCDLSGGLCGICHGTGAIRKEGTPASKDVCCNLSVMFSLRPSERIPGEEPAGYRTYLDMTVTNRSNDLIWGLLGANYVHFTMLQEYMAARLGAEVGVYHHFTNNLHVYTNNWKPEEWLGAEETLNRHTSDYTERAESSSPNGPMKLASLVHDPEVFERELPQSVENFSGKWRPEDLVKNYAEPFFKRVVQPLLIAYACYRIEDFHGAFQCADRVEADDWRVAATAWLQRRLERRTARGG